MDGQGQNSSGRIGGQVAGNRASAEDPLRATAEMVPDFVLEAEVTAKVGAAPYERSDGSSQ